jgi:hypothetical protein
MFKGKEKANERLRCCPKFFAAVLCYMNRIATKHMESLLAPLTISFMIIIETCGVEPRNLLRRIPDIPDTIVNPAAAGLTMKFHASSHNLQYVTGQWFKAGPIRFLQYLFKFFLSLDNIYCMRLNGVAL